MSHPTDLATLLALPQHRPTSLSDTLPFDLETVTQTAESIVHDTGTVQIVAAGRSDDDARAAFRDWIIDAGSRCLLPSRSTDSAAQRDAHVPRSTGAWVGHWVSPGRSRLK